MISSNPAAYIKVPKNALRNVVKRTIIMPEQFNALLEKYPLGRRLHGKENYVATTSRLHEQTRLFLTSLKIESSNRYILIGDILLGELKRCQAQQAENEKHFGDSYVYVYREANGHIERQSKALHALDSEKFSLVCTCGDVIM